MVLSVVGVKLTVPVARIRTAVLTSGMSEILGRWWNGKWGRIARRRVDLDQTDEGYQVTAREGDDDDQRVWVLPDEETARRLVADLTEVDQADPLSAGWREMPLSLYRRSGQGSVDTAAHE